MKYKNYLSHFINPPLIWQIYFIFFTSLFVTIFVSIFRSNQIPIIGNWEKRIEHRIKKEGFPLVSLIETRKLHNEKNTIFIDARPRILYQASHIPNALSLPEDEKWSAFEELSLIVMPDENIIVYCSGIDCDSALLVGQFLRNQGFENISIFAGGYKEWVKSDMMGT